MILFSYFVQNVAGIQTTKLIARMSIDPNIERKQPCEHCQDLSELEFEAIDEPHHGEDAECGECNAMYYQEWGGTCYAANEKAKQNHPELKTI